MTTDGTVTHETGGWASAACTLDHDGCVVCSDAGIPLRIVELDGDDALCEDIAGARTLIAIELVAPVGLGDVVLTHGGVAIGRAESLPGQAEDREGSREVRQ
jgi:hydrogenase expression/formation protein HypC